MLTPEQRAKIEREQSSWVRSHIKGPRANVPGGFYRAMDDIRHELVERPWYGRQVTGDLMESRPDLHRSVYGAAPQAGDDSAAGLDIHGNPIGGKSPSFYGEGETKKPPEIEPPASSR